MLQFLSSLKNKTKLCVLLIPSFTANTARAPHVPTSAVPSGPYCITEIVLTKFTRYCVKTLFNLVRRYIHAVNVQCLLYNVEDHQCQTGFKYPVPAPHKAGWLCVVPTPQGCGEDWVARHCSKRSVSVCDDGTHLQKYQVRPAEVI